MSQCLDAICRQAAACVFGRCKVFKRSGVPLGCLFVALAMFWPGSAAAFGKSVMAFPHAMTPSFRWSESFDVQVSGVPVVVRSFVAAATLEHAARVMARHQRHFQRITTLPGSILLSGVYGGRHWVAQLDDGRGMVKGMVSALPLDLTPMQNAGQSGVLAPWLTQNAQFVFGQASTAQGKTVAHSIHRPSRPLNEFVVALDQYLAAKGWRRSGGHSWARRLPDRPIGGERIDAFPVRALHGDGDVVLISQSG